MPVQLPPGGCTPVCALDHPLMCRRHHLLCIPPAGVDELGHQCIQSEPQFQHPEQSAPGGKSRHVCSIYHYKTKPNSQRHMANQEQLS